MVNPAILACDSLQYRISGVQFDRMMQNNESAIIIAKKREEALGKQAEDAFLKELIERCRHGEVAALEAVYERFKTPLFNLVHRYTYNTEVAEDLLQEIFIKIFNHIQELREEENFVGWIYRIAVNTCFSYLRSRKSPLQKTVPLDKVEGKIYDETLSGTRTLGKSLDEAIKSLPAKLKAVFLLHDVQGFKHEEIARMLSCSVGTSKSQLFKARMKIRSYLENRKVL